MNASHAKMLHFGEGEVVSVSATARGQTLRLEVIDSGPGVSPNQQEEIFKPFVSSKAGTAQPGHTGLGLAIIERHGGRIWIEPSPRGARFCAEIPASVLPQGPLPSAVAHLTRQELGAS